MLAHRDLGVARPTPSPTAGSSRSAWTTATPTIDGAQVWFCSDEHITFAPEQPARAWASGCACCPPHVDPTVALHERMHLVDGDDVLETWPVDLRGW